MSGFAVTCGLYTWIPACIINYPRMPDIFVCKRLCGGESLCSKLRSLFLVSGSCFIQTSLQIVFFLLPILARNIPISYPEYARLQVRCWIQEIIQNAFLLIAPPFKDRFTLHNFCLNLSHATCLQLELYSVYTARNAQLATSLWRFWLCKSSTQLANVVVDATVLGKSCVV